MNDDELKELRDIRVGLTALQVDLRTTVKDTLTTVTLLIERIDRLRATYRPEPESVQALATVLQHYYLYETDDDRGLSDLTEADSIQLLQTLHEQFGLVLTQGGTDDD